MFIQHTAKKCPTNIVKQNTTSLSFKYVQAVFSTVTKSSVCPSFYLINMAAVAVIPLLFNVNYCVPVEVDFMTVGLKKEVA